MVIYFKDFMKIIKETERGELYQVREASMKENGEKIINQEKQFTLLIMEISLKTIETTNKETG